MINDNDPKTSPAMTAPDLAAAALAVPIEDIGTPLPRDLGYGSVFLHTFASSQVQPGLGFIRL